MNLREFLSNNQEFNTSIHTEDLASNRQPKVLGVPWDSTKDTILLQCSLPKRDTITKRTVSQQLASVYDPLGFLVPLLLPAKIFLQSL
uniref:Dynein_C domain-containing protein n=1 Tax=Heterorhabditis bacteriophora TaxID=37862 RepID=A0A1I7WEM6_HETBA